MGDGREPLAGSTFMPAGIWRLWPYYAFVDVLIIATVAWKGPPYLTLWSGLFIAYVLAFGLFLAAFGFRESMLGARPVGALGRLTRVALAGSGVIALALLGLGAAGVWLWVTSRDRFIPKIAFAFVSVTLLASPPLSVLYADDIFRRDRAIDDRSGALWLLILIGPLSNVCYWFRFVLPDLVRR